MTLDHAAQAAADREAHVVIEWDLESRRDLYVRAFRQGYQQLALELLAFVDEHLNHVNPTEEFFRGWEGAMHNVRNKLLETRVEESGPLPGTTQGA